MTYTPPTLASLRTSLSRDLRDDDNKTFSTATVNDLITTGILEVNRIYPVQAVETVDLTETSDVLDREYVVDSKFISRVEIWREGAYASEIPVITESADSGWDLWGSTLTIPSLFTLDADTDSLKLFGYQDRDIPSDDDDTLDFDAEAEHAVRLYALVRGYQRLQNDRALFQQWLARPGNNDISPTQLDGIALDYQGLWDRYRNDIRTIRR